MTAELKLAGLKIVQDERFYIAPNGETEANEQAEMEWQEVA